MTPEKGSIYVDVDAMEWQATPFPGIEIKILYRESQGEGFTALFRAEPGARLQGETPQEIGGVHRASALTLQPVEP